MKNLFFLFFLVPIACFSQQQQDSIRKVDSIAKVDLTKKIDSLKKQLDSINKREEERKKKQIKEWTVNGRLAFIFNQASFSNWTAGGENNVAGNINVNYDFNYRNEQWKMG